jgi:hypothetical protein
MGELALLIPLGGMAMGALFLVGAYKLLVKWIDRSRADDLPPGLEDEIRALRTEVEHVREVHDRLVELEERQDFTERLLAQERDAGRLAGGRE